MRRLIALVVAALSTAAVSAPAIASAGGDCGPGNAYGTSCTASASGNGASVGHDDGSFTVGLYSSSGQAVTVSAGGHPTAHHHYEWNVVPACWRNTPDNADAVCTGFFTCPVTGDFRWFVYYRDTNVPGDNWHFAGTQCLGPDPTLNLAQAKNTIASQFTSKDVVAGTLNVQPPNAAIVNLPAVFYVLTPPKINLTLTALGRAVALTATPASYRWHWGDGTTTTTTDPGHPYPHQTVTHTYTKPGPVSVWVDVYWQATYTITGINQTFQITGPLNQLPHARTDPRTLPVAEARSHLVSG